MGEPRAPTGHELRAARKVLALLEEVARLGSGATAREISRGTGIPPATAYRLLNVLVADGYLVRIADLSGFALGRRTRELAGAVVDGPEAQEARAAVVAQLRTQVRYGVFAVSYAGDRVRVVDRDPDHELPAERLLVAHLHASAVGKLLLAARPELLAVRPRALTTHTVTAPDAVRAELELVRRAGMAREVDELRSGRSAVAVAIRAEGEVIGCLTAIGRTGGLQVDDAELLSLLSATARELSHPASADPPRAVGARTP